MHRVIKLLADLVAYHRTAAWIVIGVLSIAPFLGWCGYRLSEPEHIGWGEARDFEKLAETREAFGFPGLPCVMVVEGDDFFQPARIRSLRELVSRVESLDFVESVIWIDKIPRVSISGIGSYLPSGDPSRAELQEAKRELASHPLVANQLLSPDTRTMLMPVVLNGYDRQTTDQIRQTARGALDGSDMRVRLTGALPLMRAHDKAFEEDHLRVQRIAYVLTIILAAIIFRRVSAILVVVSGPALGIAWTLGWMWFLGEPRNELADIILPVLIVMIGFTDGVHLVVHIRQARGSGLDAGAASHSAVTHVGLACALTSITTAIGFGSLIIADSEIIRGFGRSCALGVLITFVAVTLVIPLLANSWLGRRIHLGQQQDLISRGVGRLTGVMDLVVHHPVRVAAGGVLATALLAAGALTLQPDDRLVHRIPNSTEAYQALADCDRAFGGIRYLQLSVEWPSGADNEQILEVIQRAERLLEGEPLVQAPLSVRHWLAILPGPESAAKLNLAGMIPEQFRNQFWRPDAHRALIVGRIQDLGVSRYNAVLERIERELDGISRQMPGFRFQLTGGPIVEGRIVQRVVKELAKSLALASAVIFVVMTVAFRSLRIGLISVIPNLFPLVATASMRALIDTSLDIASACSFTICLGIAVDDTIHFLSRFQYEQRCGLDVNTSIHNAFRAVGTALVMTTAVLIAGFGSVMTSQLPTHQLFAAMGCTTIGAALIGDLVILPALLVCFIRK